MVGLIRILGAVIICISITDAKVEILTEETPYKPGIDLTLICKLEQFTETAHWMSNNDTIPIAYCLWTDCSLNPHYDEKYRFAFETDPEMFNLTIINLSLDDNGTELVCSDGSHSDSLRLIVSEDKHEDKTQDKKIQDKKIKDKKIQDTKIQVKKKVLKRNSAAKSTVPIVHVVVADAAVVAVIILYIVFRNKLNVLTKTICHFKINCNIWNFLRGAKNSAGNRRNRTYDKKDVNTDEEIGFLYSNMELEATMAEKEELINQAEVRDLSYNTNCRKDEFEPKSEDNASSKEAVIEKQCLPGNDNIEADVTPQVKAIAFLDYKAEDDGDISIDPGDLITNIVQRNEGWWEGTTSSGARGIFPANYVELCDNT